MTARVVTTSTILLLIVLRTFADIDQNGEALMHYVRPTLRPVYGAARVYAVDDYLGDTKCQFPKLRMQAPSHHKLGVDAIREVFARDRRIKIVVDSARIPRIVFGKPTSSLLQTKIHRLKFNTHERYNCLSAYQAIENTKEIQSAIHNLGFDRPFGSSSTERVVVMSENVQEPYPGVRHLPSSIRDVTFDQALDLLAKTFSEVVFYEECTDSKGAREFHVSQACVLCLPWEHVDGPLSPTLEGDITRRR
jgi:hypothetical protein